MSNLDVATISQLEDTAKKLYNQNEVFSAWNITDAVRKMGFAGRHQDMKKVIHDMYQRGDFSGYLKTEVEDSKRPGTTFFLYHPNSVDPHTFDPNTGKAAQLPAPTSSNNDSDDDDSDDDSDGGVATATSTATATATTGARAKTARQSDGSLVKTLGNSKGSVLYIPKDWVAQIGAQKGQAYMEVDAVNNQIAIKASGSAKACVDKNRNIRIGKTALMKAGINGQVKVKLDGNEILISKP